SGLAESLNMRGTSRAAKSAGAKSHADSSFNDLLHTVSNLAKRALKDEGGDTTVKAGTLRTHLAHPAGKDEAVNERTEAADDAQSSHKSSDQDTDESSETQGPVDQAAKAD